MEYLEKYAQIVKTEINAVANAGKPQKQRKDSQEGGAWDVRFHTLIYRQITLKMKQL